LNCDNENLLVDTRIPKWESELWQYVGMSNGVHCPVREQCSMSKEGRWCPDRSIALLKGTLDDEQCSINKYDFLRPDNHVNCRVSQLLERLAVKYLKAGNIHNPPVRTKLINIFDKHNRIEIHCLPLKAHHGAVWNYRDNWIIQLNKYDHHYTKRFTIFHESFHILTNRKVIPVLKENIGIKDNFNEWVADYFAKSIMMPRDWVRQKWVMANDVDHISEMFAVPKAVMYVRLKQLGLI